MLDIAILRNQLQDRKIEIVAKKTGLSVVTVRNVRDFADCNPTYKTMKALESYLNEKNTSIR